MFRELCTMGLIAVTATNVSSHFDQVFGAATDISGIYQTAEVASSSPKDFLSNVMAPKKRLEKFSVATAQHYYKQEIGPFGVMVASK